MIQLRWLLPLLTALGFLASGRAAATNPLLPSERAALAAFYSATGGSGWFRRDGWLGPAGTECSWFGVSCVNQENPAGGFARVRFLNLPNNGLRGTLTHKIAQLPVLYSLDLQLNQLEGAIPRELGSLHDLGDLNLQGNRLSGPIPAELGELETLFNCSLGFNRLTGPLPPALARAKWLAVLSVAGNALSGPIPEGLGEITNLQGLDLSRNDFSGPIPAALFRPPFLDRVNLSANHLSGTLPAQIANARNLVALDLGGNQLGGTVPASLRNLDRLTLLNLDWNALATDDAALAAFVQERSPSADWRATQTLPPEEPVATATTPYAVLLTWKAAEVDLRLANHEGGFTVYRSSSPAGPFVAAKTVLGKRESAAGFIALIPGTTAYYRIDRYSLPHKDNPNLVRSQRTVVLSATTPLP